MGSLQIRIGNVLIERWDGKRVEVMMSRARTILFSLVPALLLVGSGNCFSGSISLSACDPLGSILRAAGHGKQHAPGSADSFDQAAGRWSRRINIQPGSDGFPSPVAIARSQYVLPVQTIGSCHCARAAVGLAQSWQFHWRTALEPRAPSSVSQFCS
jgi:hypothetical protein